ncbi:hypothetical protein F5B22DRAFT_660065 [Xylaria bambusicola]|uniref:uncharacterized protein n=1 Tax=Xylaria bambusicola TaxID=326684 RepID=UPI002007805D|nr:uncharacterized protein F5B22DRAFT_660065 [Xylaria bambusicola]KAI0506669.1 hypothetical protein F5B22DRAFT_660065 [Xylaria bambusicola]
MGFVEENDIEEILADDEFPTDSDEMSVDSDEQPSEDEAIITLQPKIPFSQRANALIQPGDKQFQKIENYFFSLLSNPEMSVDGILEGTFDDHEIMLITPQSEPLDVVRFQLRNAQRYYENLETRFKGHTETLAFKMTCLYFGLPVAPMRSGTSLFSMSPDPSTLETSAASKPNPLQFLEKHDNEDESIHGANTLSLRGGTGDYEGDDGMRGLFTPIDTPKEFAFEFGKGIKVEEDLNYVFRNSVNTSKEAKRARELRNRSFTQVSTIFTNPLKPVMPLDGPPLESVIKTGPSMPGVTIAMLTPTEVLRLQQEVHSLRFQLLDRTRECPYADCERYFTFSDGAGLDQHIREDHAVLRCFLCGKNSNLLPYYDTNRIKEHFVTEHLKDILRVYTPERLTRIPSEETEYESVEISEEDDSPPGPFFRYHPDDERLWNPKTRPAWERVVNLIKAGKDPWDKREGIRSENTKKKEEEVQAAKRMTPPVQTVPAVKDKSKDSGVSFSVVEPLLSPAYSDVGKTPSNLVPKATTPTRSVKTPKTAALRTPETTPPKTPKTPKAAVPKTPLSAVRKAPPPPAEPESMSFEAPVRAGHERKTAKPTITKSKTEDGRAEIFTLVNPSPSTFEKNGAWIKGVLERYVAADGATLYGVDNDSDTDSPPGKKGYKIFTAINTAPGTFEENAKFIREQLQQYVAEGGELPSIKDDWASKQGDRKSTNNDSPSKKGKRKRRAATGYSQLTGSDIDEYEYSEKSAVSDGPENLSDVAPPPAKRVNTAAANAMSTYVPVPAPEGIEDWSLSSPSSNEEEEEGWVMGW